MDIVARYSGLKLNMNKSKALALSDAEDSTSEIDGLEVAQRLHILGV